MRVIIWTTMRHPSTGKIVRADMTHEASGGHRGDIVDAIEVQVCSDGY